MSTTKSELRFTDTNAASDSKGRTWGLEGGLFWWLIGGIGAGIIVFFVLLVPMNSSLTFSFVAALVPVSICLAYIFALRQGKPLKLRVLWRVGMSWPWWVTASTTQLR